MLDLRNSDIDGPSIDHSGALDDEFFDLCLSLLDAGLHEIAVSTLIGFLNAGRYRPESWGAVQTLLRAHPLHQKLLEDPMAARSFARPRGYAGDAELIDMLYGLHGSQNCSALGGRLLKVTSRSTSAMAVRLRKEDAKERLTLALSSGARILSLACGHFREGDEITAEDLSQVTVVDQDPLSLEVVRQRHGDALTIVEANVFAFLRSAKGRGAQWDYIYTLGLTDYFDDRAMDLFHTLLKAILAPQGRFVLANFLPNHLTAGWMEAVMDWHLIYRSEEQLAGHARRAGFTARTWSEATRSIAWCEMEHA